MSGDADGSPPRAAWKYSWSSDFSAPPLSSRRLPSGAGSKASERLYNEAKSGRQAREALQRRGGEEGGFPIIKCRIMLATCIPFPS